MYFIIVKNSNAISIWNPGTATKAITWQRIFTLFKFIIVDLVNPSQILFIFIVLDNLECNFFERKIRI